MQSFNSLVESVHARFKGRRKTGKMRVVFHGSCDVFCEKTGKHIETIDELKFYQGVYINQYLKERVWANEQR